MADVVRQSAVHLGVDASDNRSLPDIAASCIQSLGLTPGPAVSTADINLGIDEPARAQLVADSAEYERGREAPAAFGTATWAPALPAPVEDDQPEQAVVDYPSAPGVELMEREEAEEPPRGAIEKQSSCCGLCVESDADAAQRVAAEEAEAARREAAEAAERARREAVEAAERARREAAEAAERAQREAAEAAKGTKDAFALMPLTRMRAEGYILGLKEAGVLCTGAKAAGYEVAEVKAGGFTAAEAHAAGYEVKEAYSAAEGKASGMTMGQVKDAGYEVAEAKAGGFTAAEAHAAGYEVKAAYSAAEGKASGMTMGQAVVEYTLLCGEAKELGYVEGLKAAGFSLADAMEAGYLLPELVRCGYAREELLGAGFFLPNVQPGEGTLQAALNAAKDGDELVLADGTYTGSGDNVLEISKSITIRANPRGAILNGQKVRRIMHITSGTVVLDGLDITSGSVHVSALAIFGSSTASVEHAHLSVIHHAPFD